MIGNTRTNRTVPRSTIDRNTEPSTSMTVNLHQQMICDKKANEIQLQAQKRRAAIGDVIFRQEKCKRRPSMGDIPQELRQHQAAMGDITNVQAEKKISIKGKMKKSKLSGTGTQKLAALPSVNVNVRKVKRLSTTDVMARNVNRPSTTYVMDRQVNRPSTTDVMDRNVNRPSTTDVMARNVNRPSTTDVMDRNVDRPSTTDVMRPVLQDLSCENIAPSKYMTVPSTSDSGQVAHGTHSHQNTSTKHVLGGEPAYKTMLDLDVSHLQRDVIELPPSYPPLLETHQVNITKDTPWVFFDLETTGFGNDSHICQIGATKNDGSEFSCYVFPGKAISSNATSVTGLMVSCGKLHHYGKPVQALSIKKALQTFCHFLSETKSLLVGHNIKKFDTRILYNCLHNCNMVYEFSSHVVGFLDTYILYKRHFPGKSSYKQTSLVSSVLGDNYNAHDALGDARSLQQLVNATPAAQSDPENMAKSLFSVQFAISSYEQSKRMRGNMPSFSPLVSNKVVSDGIARKMATSGLRLAHLISVYQKTGREGISCLFSEKTFRLVRVTKQKRIIDAVCHFLLNM